MGPQRRRGRRPVPRSRRGFLARGCRLRFVGERENHRWCMQRRW